VDGMLFLCLRLRISCAQHELLSLLRLGDGTFSARAVRTRVNGCCISTVGDGRSLGRTVALRCFRATHSLMVALFAKTFDGT